MTFWTRENTMAAEDTPTEDKILYILIQSPSYFSALQNSNKLAVWAVYKIQS